MSALPPALLDFRAVLAAATDAEPGGSDLMLVVAHPDDETAGLGGHLRRLRRATIVHVTDGAPRDLRDARRYGFRSAADYAAAREAELDAALSLAGIAPERRIALGIPDQKAARELAQLARRLHQLIEERRPRFILTHPFEGGHPDHDATAFAVWAACRALEDAPAIVEMAFYHSGPDGTPVFQRFLGHEPELVVPLDQEAWRMKARMLACHVTQKEVMAPFSARAERFRLAPAYDFAAPANGGRVLYDAWRLGFAGAEWPAAAAAALRALQAEPA